MNVHIFDCDGVIVDSNTVKTEAFKEIGKKFFDKNCCDDLMRFHANNGGRSRWEKFAYVIKKNYLKNVNLDELCSEYSLYVEKKIFNCNVVPGIKNYIDDLNSKENDNSVFVVSAGEQNQVKRLIEFHNFPILQERIFGSPKKKLDIIKFLKNRNKEHNFFIYGDSLHDAECAYKINSEFIFIKGFSNYNENKILDKYPVTKSINDFSNISFINQKIFTS